MKAAFFQEHGSWEKMRYGDLLPEPEPKPGHALVRVRACALNHVDIWVRNGAPFYPVSLPHVLGADIAGELVSTGDEVVVLPGLSCGQCPQCLAGRDNQCERFKIVGAASWGGYAELVQVPERNIFPMPPHLSFEEAASFPLTFLTAWHMLAGRAQLAQGETVLVLGASAGVGSAAIQIGKALGARVIAVSSSPEKCEKARSLGADAAVNGQTEDFAKAVNDLTQGRGADVVFEHVGAATWDRSMDSLARCGRLVTCGSTTGGAVGLELRSLFAKDLSILGARMGTRREFAEVLERFRKKEFKPMVSRVFSLEEAGEAQRFLEDRGQFGKVVLKVA